MLDFKLPTRTDLILVSRADSPAGRVSGKRLVRKSQILNAVRRAGELSRVEISRQLGYNFRSVTLLADELVHDGILKECAPRKTSSGHRPVPLRLVNDAACVLGIDNGRARTRALIMDLAGNVLARTETPSDFGCGIEEQLAWFETFLADFLRPLGRGLPPLAGCGITCDGFMYKQRTAGLPGSGTEVYARTQELLGVPVTGSLSDSRMLAIAIRFQAKEPPPEDMVVLNVTDGLGSAPFVKGATYVGNLGWAGEVGHLPLGDPGVPCHCGGNACLENIASGTGLVRMAAREGLIPSPDLAHVHRLAARARSGDAEVQKIWARLGQGLGKAVGICEMTFNPESIVIGGKLACHADLFETAMREEAARFAAPYVSRETKLEISLWTDEGVVTGTCVSVLNRIFDAAHVPLEHIL